MWIIPNRRIERIAAGEKRPASHAGLEAPAGVHCLVGTLPNIRDRQTEYNDEQS